MDQIETTTFTNSILDSLSPWNDESGYWQGYNTALASIYEAVYSLVADQGSQDAQVIATLSEDLVIGVATTALPVNYLAAFVPAGTTLTLTTADASQSWTTTADANVGDSTIAVASQLLNYSYPRDTQVIPTYVPGWSRLLDPNNCPDQYLPFLAQFNGTPVPTGLAADQARLMILHESASSRGTVSSITHAVQRYLTGSKSVSILERTNQNGNEDGYWFIVVVRPEEIPSVNVLVDAVNSVKPGGVMWLLVQTDAWIIATMEAEFSSIAVLEAAFPNITKLEAGPLLILLDAAQTSEAIVIVIGWIVRPAEATATSETIAVTLEDTSIASDSTATSETIAVTLVKTVSATDSTTTSETVSRTLV